MSNRRECSIHTPGKFLEPTEYAEEWILRELDEREDAMTDKEILILTNVISISGAWQFGVPHIFYFYLVFSEAFI